MSSTTLHILHLEPNTGNPKVDEVAKQRYGNLMIELKQQGITDYSLIEGYYVPENVKLAIHKGHRKIVQHAKEQGYKNCLVAEDDIKFTHPCSFKYFLSQIPESYDLMMGLIYAGTIEDNRVLNGFSGGMTLYSISSRYYQEFLDLPIDTHIDRECGLSCFNHEFYVVPEYCVIQRGGYSHQLRQVMYYDVYLDGKVLYSGE